MPQNEDPFVNGLFWLGIILGSGMLALRLAGIFWSLFLHVWQVFVLLGAALLGICCFGAALSCSCYVPMRTDVDLDDLSSPKYDDEDLYAMESDEWPPNPAKALRKKIEQLQEKRAEQEEPAQAVPELPVTDPREELLKSPLHCARDLDNHQQSFLQQNKYELKEFVPLGKVRREKFYVKAQSRQTLKHTFVLYSIAQKLKNKVSNLAIGDNARKPDLTFTYKDQEYAVEVVTPLQHKNFFTKADANTKKYGAHWWIVVTDSAYARPFHDYGRVLTRNNIDHWMHNDFDTE
jgi:hypothetical protein